ncbi:MAG TPA: hypothetical protein VKE24_01150 [Candidatus Acidoferrales bacterium]|nr:hypothetical protein [Candidatus Acidoferrales bacterium]
MVRRSHLLSEGAADCNPGRLGVKIPSALLEAKNPTTVRRIVAAAELAGARTDEIARAARVNEALLHYYSGSKENLHRVAPNRSSASCSSPSSTRRPPIEAPGLDCRALLSAAPPASEPYD